MKGKLTRPNLNSQTTSEQKWMAESLKAIRAGTYYPWNPALFCTNLRMFLFGGLTNCANCTSLSHTATVKIGTGKRLSREKVNRRVHKRPHASPLSLRCSAGTIGQRYVLEIPLISDPRSGASGSVSQLSGVTGEKRAGLTLVAPESSGSVVNDWFTFTVSTVSQQIFTNQTQTPQTLPLKKHFTVYFFLTQNCWEIANVCTYITQ